MAEELISKYVDRASFASDTKFIIDSLTQAEVAFTKLDASLSKGLSFSTKDYTQQSKDAVLATNQLNTAVNNQAVAFANNQKATQQATAAASQNITAQQQQTRTLEQNIEARRKLQNTLDSKKKDDIEDLALLKQKVITEAEYLKRITASTAAQEKYKAQIKEYDNEIKAQAATTKTRALEAEKAARAEAKIVLELSNDYKQLSAAYNEAALRAKNLALSQGSNSIAAKAAAAEAQVLGNKLKEVDASVGQYQRNVGNYAGGILDAGKKAFGVVRTLENILPGLGISGIFLLAFEGVKALAEGLGILSKKTDEAAATRKILNEVVSEGNRGAAQQITDLKILYSTATDANIPLKERLSATKALKDEFPSYFKGISDEIILNGGAKDSYDALSKSIIASSRARAAKNKIDELTNTQLDIDDAVAKIKAVTDAEIANQKLLASEEKLLPKIQKLKDKGFTAYYTDEEKAVNQKLNAINAINKRREEALKELDKRTELTTGRINQLIKLAGVPTLIDEITPDKKPEKPNNDKEKAAKDEAKRLEDLRKREESAAFEFQKNILEKVVADQNRILQIETATIEQKIEAASNGFLIQKRILEEQADFDIKTKKLTANEEKVLKQKLNYDLENLAIQYYDSLDKLKKGEDKRISDSAKLEKDRMDKDFQDFEKNEEKKTQSYIDEYLRRIKKQEDADKKAKDEQLAREKAFQDKLKELAFEGLETVVAFVNASFDNKKNLIQDEIDAVEKQKQADIDRVNATTLSEQDKAAKLTSINIKAQADREALERRQREIDQKKAQFDRVVSIAKIIANTAIAVSAAVAASPLTLGLPFSAIAAAIGALQIAQVLATPIPKFRRGKTSSYEGPAIVGDGGVPEYIHRADGTIEKTPSTDTLTYLGKKDVVFPDMRSMMNAFAMPTFSDRVHSDGSQKIIDGLGRKIEQLEHVIANKVETHFHWDNGQLRKSQKNGQAFTEWVTRST